MGTDDFRDPDLTGAWIVAPVSAQRGPVAFRRGAAVSGRIWAVSSRRGAVVSRRIRAVFSL